MPRFLPWRRNRAIFCMAKNESVFLPIWTRYYSRYFKARDIYILDHASDDDSIEAAAKNRKINIQRLDHAYYNDFDWYTPTIKETQVNLLKRYRIVVFAEPDEILYHPDGLDRYLARFQKSAVRATGFDLFHDPAKEPPLDLTTPILGQRAYWIRSKDYDKALISRKALNWTHGFHTASNCSEIDPDLLLIHLRRMDYELARERVRATRNYSTPQRSIDLKLGWHNRADDVEFDEHYFKQQRTCTNPNRRIREIPAGLRRNPPV